MCPNICINKQNDHFHLSFYILPFFFEIRNLPIIYQTQVSAESTPMHRFGKLPEIGQVILYTIYTIFQHCSHFLHFSTCISFSSQTCILLYTFKRPHTTSGGSFNIDKACFELPDTKSSNQYKPVIKSREISSSKGIRMGLSRKIHPSMPISPGICLLDGAPGSTDLTNRSPSCKFENSFNFKYICNSLTSFL